MKAKLERVAGRRASEREIKKRASCKEGASERERRNDSTSCQTSPTLPFSFSGGTATPRSRKCAATLPLGYVSASFSSNTNVLLQVKRVKWVKWWGKEQAAAPSHARPRLRLRLRLRPHPRPRPRARTGRSGRSAARSGRSWRSGRRQNRDSLAGFPNYII